jgi:hypothetical protein
MKFRFACPGAASIRSCVAVHEIQERATTIEFLILLGPALVADSLCPARKERRICETEVQIEHSG